MFERLFALETLGIKLGLSNITTLCEALGHPERAFASIHIAGTNGKGSVAAMVHAALVAAGIPAARYTSPHLADLTERFAIGRAAVDPQDLRVVTDLVLNRADELLKAGTLAAPPTFFEATTAAAFELFRRHRVDMAVIEVGLGGRFDATNVISPLVGAITSIGLDHQAQLGETLDSVAYEKAGIIKVGMPVVTGPLPPEAAATIARVARIQQAVLVPSRAQIALSGNMDNGHAVLSITTPVHRYETIRLALRGEHQVDNALVALRILEILREQEVAIPFDAIAQGLAKAEWPGRLEVIDGGDGRRILLDAAHNPDGAVALARYLSRWYSCDSAPGSPDRPALVFGVMRDKDIDGMLRALLPAVGIVVATAPPMARAQNPAAVAAAVHAIDPARRVIEVADPANAIDQALERSETVCVAGSIFLVGAAREVFKRRAILR